MAWVKAEYANEFGVLSTWLAVLLPWTVSYTDEAPLASVVFFFRFGLLELQLRFPSEITLGGVPLAVRRALDAAYSGGQVAGNFYLDAPVLAVTTYGGTLQVAYVAYTAGALVLLGAFALSLAMYFYEDEMAERLPKPYPRVAGWSLAVVTAAYAVATALLYVADGGPSIGTTIPVGVVVLAALAYALVGADLRESPA